MTKSGSTSRTHWDVWLTSLRPVTADGFWDEVIVESADFVDAHPFIERCLASLRERLGGTLPESGSPSRNALDFKALVLTSSMVAGCSALLPTSRSKLAETGPADVPLVAPPAGALAAGRQNDLTHRRCVRAGLDGARAEA